MSHHKAYYTRTIKRSQAIAQTLLVLFLALLIAALVNGWDTIAHILRILGVIS
jgi:hypothetical protein